MSRADVNGAPGPALYKDPASSSAHLLPGSARTPRGLHRPSMRRAPLPVLAVTALLLASQAASLGVGRAPGLDGSAEDGLSLRLRRRQLQLLGHDGAAAPAWLLPPLRAPGSDQAALLVRFLHPAGELRRRLAELSRRLKRQDPPLSIDLTFHLLREMMEISRAESQRSQAEQNRLLLDSVGK